MGAGKIAKEELPPEAFDGDGTLNSCYVANHLERFEDGVNHKGRKSVSIELSSKLETITPEIAAKLLKTNYKKQRELVSAAVATYAAAMIDGTFNAAHPPIVISDKGNLIDGQHRLAAIVECEIPQRMFVTRGVDESTFAYIDIGKKRTMADRTGLERKRTEILSAIVRACFASTVRQKPELTLRLHSRLSKQLDVVAVPKAKRNLTATFRGAIALIMKMFPEHEDKLAKQFTAFMLDDYPGMDARTVLLHKRFFVQNGEQRGRSGRNYMLIFELTISALHPDAGEGGKFLRPNIALKDEVIAFARKLGGQLGESEVENE